MSDTYRLQLRHGAEVNNFSTRNEVTAYIKGQLQYGGVSLLPYEPILFYYGEEGAKNAMILVGLPEGKHHDGNSYFIVDTADLQEKIDNMGGKYDDAIEELKLKDEELETAIKVEEEERKSAIENEANTRAEADDEETKARVEKDSELEKSIADEVETREKSDELLKESIDFTKDDLESVIEACGLIYNEKLSADRVSYVPDTHDEIIRDAESLSDAVDKISKFVSKLGRDVQLKVKNTDTVKLTLEANENDNGSTLIADVNIAGVDGLSKLTFDNNIIGKTSDGIYASASLVPSTKNPNILIFTTSGYVDGKFKVDAFETEVELTAYTGDSGKNTGVNVNVDATENKISAELNLSNDTNNILKLKDGEYVVEGTSKNIKYKDRTVFSELNFHEQQLEEIEETIDFVKAVEVKPSESDTVSVTVEKSTKGDFVVGANVKLSTDKSIIISDGGLKADVSASFKKGTSTLSLYVGKNEYDIDLSDLAVSVLKSAQYDASTEELVLEFIVGDTTKTVRIPVGTLIHDIEVDDTDTVDMTLKSVSGGPNHISAEVKVDKTHSDNILTITSNGLYVAKAYITEAVKEEADERKAADDEIKATLANVLELANSNKEAIATEASTARAAEKANADAIAQEIKDARKAEEANATAIVENKTAIKANEVAIATEEGRAKAAEQSNATAITAEETRAMAAETKNASDINAEITRATEKEADLLGKIGDNTEKINENKSAIVSEVERATKAEKEINDKAVANDTAIKAEVTRATAAESANATAIATETTRATTAEAELKTDVDKNKADINAANTAISNEVTRAKSVEADLTTKLTDETTRAKAAEAANATAITTEKERAEHIESDLFAKTKENADNIATLTSEVGNIELKKEGDLSYALYVNGTKHGEFIIPKDQFLKSVNYNATTKELVFVFNTSEGETTTTISIADLIDTYNAGEGLVLNGNTFSVNFTTVASVEAMQASVNAEATRAMTEETKNAQAIVTENERAMTAEAELKADIDKNKTDIANAKAVADKAASDLSVEVSRANAAEAANAQSVVTEKERSMAAELVLDGKIANVQTIADGANTTASKAASDLVKEIERATAAEQANTTAISKEINDARTAENNLKVNLEGAIATEKERAKDAESALAEKIAKNATDIESINTEIGNIELKKEGDLSYALYVNGTKHGEFIIPKDQFLKSVNYNATTKELVFVFNTSEGETTTTISIADLIDTYNAGEGLVLNGNTFSVDLTKISTIESVNSIVEQERLRASAEEGKNSTEIKTVKENLSTVSEKLDGTTTDVSNLSTKLESEITRSTAKDEELANNIVIVATSISETSQKVSAVETTLSKVSSKLESEITRSTAKDEELAKAISDANILINNKANSSDVYTKEEVVTELSKYAKTETVNSELEKKLNVTDAQNVYATKDALEDVKDSAATIVYVDSKLSEKLNVTDAQNVYATKDALEDVKDSAATIVYVNTHLADKLNVADAQNVYATKESVQDIKDGYTTSEYVDQLNSQLSERVDSNKDAIGNINLTFNGATSELVYTDKNGLAHTYQLYSGSLIKKGEFNPLNNSIVLTIENAGIESQITIPVSELLSDLSEKIQNNTDNIAKVNEAIAKLAKDWTVSSSSTVELTKTTVGEKDTLSAMVRVASSNKQAIQSKGDGLYVSNDLEDYTCVYGSEGTISAQTAVAKLVEESISTNNKLDNYITLNNKEIETLTNNFNKVSSDVENLKTSVNTVESELYLVKRNVEINSENITTVGNRVSATEAKITTIESNISTLQGRLASTEQEVITLKQSVNDILTNKLATLTQAVERLQTIVNGIVAPEGTVAHLEGEVADLKGEVTKIDNATGYSTYPSNIDNMSERITSLEETVDNQLTDDINEIQSELGDKDKPSEGTIWYEINNMVDAGTF